MLDPELRRALAYVAPYWRRLAVVVAISLASTFLSLWVPYLSKYLVDRALIGRDATALARIVLAFAAVTAVAFALNVWSGLRYTRVSAEILFDMRLALYRHLQGLSPRFYARTRLGDIVSRLNNDIAEIQRVAAETALAWFGNALFLLGTIAMMAWLDPRLCLLSLALLPPSVVALVRYRRALEGRIAELRERSSDIGSFLIETLQGMKLVVGSNAQEREIARFRQKNDGFITALMSMQRVTYLAGGLPGVILAATTAGVFLYGGQRVIAGTLTLGTFVAFMAYQMRLLPPIQGLMGLYANLAAARVSFRRVNQILDASPDVVQRQDAIALPDARGDVAFENVSLSFDRGAPALEGVSFSARPGEIVAIVGPSGSGKSTIADLMLRLLDPDEGRVSLDGHDLRAVRLPDVRRHVALVDQDPAIFHATIAENLRYGRPDASDEALMAAARAAGLEAFIEGLPEKLRTIVGERGAALSAGERQRIAIARALLLDPAVLILDEATASLDPLSEELVVRGYEAAMRGRTTILISHRFSLASRADHVIVVDGRRVVEIGSPMELLQRQGAFADLFARG